MFYKCRCRVNDGLVGRDTLDRKTDTNLDTEEHLLIKAGDIAYNMMRMWQGASGLAKHDGIVSPAYVVLAPKNGIDPLFASYWFKSPRMVYLFWAYSYGLTNDRLRLYFKDFSEIPVSAPPHDEQVKIGEILSLWDTAIAQTEKLIEAKRKLKKGLMQQLLTGKRRFPGFGPPAKHGELPKNWAIIRLGQLGDTYSGLSGKRKEDFGEGTPFIPYLNIFSNSKVDPNTLDYVRVSKGERQNAVKYGDIFFTTSSETPEDVGMSSVLLDDIGEAYLNSFCSGFRLKTFDNLLPEYARQLLRGPVFRKAIYKLAQGATRHNLSKTQLLKINVSLPPIDEQQQIASVLDSTESEIERIKQMLEKLNAQKRGLLQKLLTGQIRVKGTAVTQMLQTP